MTRSSPRHHTKPECHVLNFFHDNDDGCALTVLVRGYRFHIIADADQLKSKSGKDDSVGGQYRSLVSAFHAAVEKECDPEGYAQKLRNEEKGSGSQGSRDTFDSGLDSATDKDSNADDANAEDAAADEDNDSAVDVRDMKAERDVVHGGSESTDAQVDNPEQALQNWMLAPFADIFDELDQPSTTTDEQSLAEWYSGPTYFYNLDVQAGQLKASELESQPDLEKRIEELIPHIHVPKYVTNMDVPWFRATDLTVVSESEEPDPYHPCRVKVDNVVHFLKLVDTTQPDPVKRELKILNQIETKGLNTQIKVPRLTGFVGYASSKTEIMGFLLTDIDDPTPLTKMLDSDVIEEKREKWATEVDTVIKVLHKNNIIWGDAKADNFMIDRHGELWIIDFGGSYTEGWVDPALAETKEGDIMGVEKVVNALEDPEANTYDPDEENRDSAPGATPKKRTRDDSEGTENERNSPKRRKS